MSRYARASRAARALPRATSAHVTSAAGETVDDDDHLLRDYVPENEGSLPAGDQERIQALPALAAPGAALRRHVQAVAARGVNAERANAADDDGPLWSLRGTASSFSKVTLVSPDREHARRLRPQACDAHVRARHRRLRAICRATSMRVGGFDLIYKNNAMVRSIGRHLRRRAGRPAALAAGQARARAGARATAESGLRTPTPLARALTRPGPPPSARLRETRPTARAPHADSRGATRFLRRATIRLVAPSGPRARASAIHAARAPASSFEPAGARPPARLPAFHERSPRARPQARAWPAPVVRAASATARPPACPPARLSRARTRPRDAGARPGPRRPDDPLARLPEERASVRDATPRPLVACRPA